MAEPKYEDLLEMERQKLLQERAYLQQQIALHQSQPHGLAQQMRAKAMGKYNFVRKSQLVSFLVTGVFGPLGLFYSSPGWAIVMFIMTAIFVPFLGPVAVLIGYGLSVLIGAMATSSYNDKMKVLVT